MGLAALWHVESSWSGILYHLSHQGSPWEESRGALSLTVLDCSIAAQGKHCKSESVAHLFSDIWRCLCILKTHPCGSFLPTEHQVWTSVSLCADVKNPGGLQRIDQRIYNATTMWAACHYSRKLSTLLNTSGRPIITVLAGDWNNRNNPTGVVYSLKSSKFWQLWNWNRISWSVFWVRKLRTYEKNFIVFIYFFQFFMHICVCECFWHLMVSNCFGQKLIRAPCELSSRSLWVLQLSLGCLQVNSIENSDRV